MRKIVGHDLWLGNAGDLRDPRPLLAAGVEAIVELADNEPFAPLPRELVRCRFPCRMEATTQPGCCGWQ